MQHAESKNYITYIAALHAVDQERQGRSYNGFHTKKAWIRESDKVKEGRISIAIRRYDISKIYEDFIQYMPNQNWSDPCLGLSELYQKGRRVRTY